MGVGDRAGGLLSTGLIAPSTVHKLSKFSDLWPLYKFYRRVGYNHSCYNRPDFRLNLSVSWVNRRSLKPMFTTAVVTTG